MNTMLIFTVFEIIITLNKATDVYNGMLYT